MNATPRLAGVLTVLTVGLAACATTGSTPNKQIATTTDAPRPATSAANPTTTAAASPATSVLPAPNGPHAVGAIATPMPGAIVFYPAQVNTGSGQHPYLDPALAASLGVPAETISGLTTTTRTGATPLATKTARPVVVLAPGFGSLIALSTALAEHLASNGYVVLAVQADVAAEAGTMPPPTPAQERARLDQIAAALDLVTSPAFASLVGEVDADRIAVGGHSYAGSIAFNTSLHDPRVTAVFDLDGRLFGEAATVPTRVPSLIVASSASGTSTDQQMRDLIRLGSKTVAVGLLHSDHFDLTDAAAISDLLHATGAMFAVGTIGAVAVDDTSTIVQRFLDRAFEDGIAATQAELIDNLPGTTAHAFGTTG